MKGGGITASELMRQLHADPEWVAAEALREAARQKRREQYREEKKDLIAELRSIGLQVQDISDLLPMKSYTEALPILLRHLSRTYSPNIKEMIARAMAVPEAAFAHEELVAMLYRQIQEEAPSREVKGFISGVAQGLAVAVAASTTEKNIASLLRLVRDASIGDDRLLFLYRLRRSKRPEAAAVLEELAQDPVFAKEIASWKRRSRKKTAKAAGEV